MEPENDKWRWNDQEHIDVDHVIELARRHRISIIPYFDNFMPWGEIRKPDSDNTDGPMSRGQHQAPDSKEYSDYVFAVVERLVKGGVEVSYVELDNEPSNLCDGYVSRNAFVNVSAKQIKESENAAYDRIKAAYPKMLVGSTTFSFPALDVRAGRAEDDMKRKALFVKAYFEDEPKPRFDFLGIHEVLSGSGSPSTTCPNPDGGVPAFASYNGAYDLWRGILDKHGRSEAPILNLESAAVEPGLQDAVLIQRAVFAKANAKKNKVAGWILSQLTGSKKFTEGEPGRRISVGITRLAAGYELREGYYGFYALMAILARYPEYRGRTAGELNRDDPWVESFADGGGQMLYVAFVPYHCREDKARPVTLRVGRQATVTRSDMKSSTMAADGEGNIKLAVTRHPVFVEAGKPE